MLSGDFNTEFSKWAQNAGFAFAEFMAFLPADHTVAFVILAGLQG